MGEKLSLVIPVKNEEGSVQGLLDSITGQTVLPDEVVIVDGGSGDRTRAIIKKNIGKVPFTIKLVETENSLPGEGRNRGVKESSFDMIAFTDGGIKLDKLWIEELRRPVEESKSTDVVYGRYEPLVNSFLKECSLIAYVPAKEKVGGVAFRTNSIVSSLFKKDVFERAGGFPPFRAAEDKIFMENVERLGVNIAYTDKAIAYWEIAGSVREIYDRFCAYSAHDLLAGRAKDWHYSVFRTYGIILLFLLLGAFINSIFFFGVLALWIARLANVFFRKKEDFKWKFLLDIRYLSGIIWVLFVTDIALFCGTRKYIFMNYAKHK